MDSLSYMYSPRPDLAVFADGLLVVHVLSQASAGASADTVQLSQVVSQLLDGCHLLSQEVLLDEVAHLGIVVGGGSGMQFQEGLVDTLLQLQSGGDAILQRAPTVLVWLLDVLQHDGAAALVLELHQLLGMLALLVGSGEEVLVSSGEGDIGVVVVKGQRQVGVGSEQLQVDLLVHSGLTLFVVVLTDVCHLVT